MLTNKNIVYIVQHLTFVRTITLSVPSPISTGSTFTFSNPSIPEIEQRLFPFIEKLQKAHPGVPLIFQRTIYRERRNFSQSVNKFEGDRQHRAEQLMKEACKRYKDVYYIDVTNATSPTHETSVDGTHPGDYGYTLWAESLRKPLLKILKKYGIK